MGDVEGETLEKTLHHCLAEVEATKPDDTLRNMGAEALGDTLTDRLAEVKAGKVGDIDRSEGDITSPNACRHAGRDGGGDCPQNTERCRDVFCHTIRGSGKDNWAHTNVCRA